MRTALVRAAAAAAAAATGPVPCLGVGEADEAGATSGVWRASVLVLCLAGLMWSVGGLVNDCGAEIGVVAGEAVTGERVTALAAWAQQPSTLSWDDVKSGAALVWRVLRLRPPLHL